MRVDHVTDIIPAYLNGTLSPGDERHVCEHLETCAGCRSELASWETVGEATRTASSQATAPSQDLMERVWTKIQQDEQAVPADSQSSSTQLSLVWQLLAGQLPLIRKEIWAASAMTMGIGCMVSLMISTDVSAAGGLLAVFAPVVAAVGVAFVYGPENDPSLELALSTPTRPRLILLARLTLVYCYDLALALAATGILAAANGTLNPWPLISLWIGPMLFLSALALLISLFFGPTPAVFTAMALWGVRLSATPGSDPRYLDSVWMRAVETLWQANAVLLPLAVLLLATAFFYAPRRVGPSQVWAN